LIFRIKFYLPPLNERAKAISLSVLVTDTGKPEVGVAEKKKKIK